MTFNPFAAWYPGWWGDRQGSLSGDVSQWFKIFSPTITITGRGEPELEAQIVREVATYGAQLAPIIDLVLAQAEGKTPPPEALADLQRIRREVQEKKEFFRASAKDRARQALEALRSSDPDAVGPLLDEFRAPKTT